MPLPQIDRFQAGEHTQRNPLDTPFSVVGLNVVQHHDALYSGLNTEISNLNTLVRRPGWTQFSTATFQAGEIPQKIRLYRDLSATYRNVVDTNQRLVQVQPGTITTVFNKTSSALSSLVTVGQWLYSANGNDADCRKWNGSIVDKWGIAAPVAAPTYVFNPLTRSTYIASRQFASTDTFQGAINLQVGTNAALTVTFTSPVSLATIASTLNGSTLPAAVTVSTSKTTAYTGTGGGGGGGTYFGLDVVTTTAHGAAVGQYVTLAGSSAATANGNFQVYQVVSPTEFLVNFYSTTAVSGTGGTSQLNTPVSYGVTATVFGTNPQSLQIVSNTPGLSGVLKLSSNIVDVTSPAVPFQLIIGDGVVNQLAPVFGYSYVYCYANSSTGHVSTASPVSATLGPQAIAGSVTISYVASTDPQVDTIQFYRTVDGGSSYDFFFQVVNATANFTDSNPDSFLNPLILAPINSANNPPPTGFNGSCFYTGRIWGFVNNILYYAGGPDTTNGVGAESFPPANFFTAPSTIVKLIPTSNGMFVFLKDDLWWIQGTDSASYEFTQFATGLGILNPDAVCTDGQSLYVYTTRSQLYSLSAQGSKEIGFPIGDKLATFFSPSTTTLTLHRGSSTDNALYVSNGVDKIRRYYVAGDSWSPYQAPLMTCGTIQSIEVAPNNVALIMGQSTAGGKLWFRNPFDWSDNGVPYAANAQIGGLILAPPGSYADVETILLQMPARGTLPAVSMLNQELTGTPQQINNPVPDPPQLATSKTLWTYRWYLKSSTTPIPQRMNTTFITVTWNVENAQNELYGMYMGATK